jgi:hypothetical protein
MLYELLITPRIVKVFEVKNDTMIIAAMVPDTLKSESLLSSHDANL